MLTQEVYSCEAGGAQRAGSHPANDNSIGSLGLPRGVQEEAERRYRLAAFPPGTSALIRRRHRPVNQIGRARENEWLLCFEPKSRLFVDPLTGWAAASDPLQHVELRFASLAEAIRYAERHALPYRIYGTIAGQPIQSKTKEAQHEQAA